jgi:hypothetical protein
VNIRSFAPLPPHPHRMCPIRLSGAADDWRGAVLQLHRVHSPASLLNLTRLHLLIPLRYGHTFEYAGVHIDQRPFDREGRRNTHVGSCARSLSLPLPPPPFPISVAPSSSLVVVAVDALYFGSTPLRRIEQVRHSLLHIRFLFVRGMNSYSTEWSASIANSTNSISALSL